MRHRHIGPKVRYRTRRNNIRYRQRPTHSQMDKYKNLNYNQLRKRFRISPLADDDKDKVKNKDDCRPWDKKRHLLGIFSKKGNLISDPNKLYSHSQLIEMEDTSLNQEDVYDEDTIRIRQGKHAGPYGTHNMKDVIQITEIVTKDEFKEKLREDPDFFNNFMDMIEYEKEHGLVDDNTRLENASGSAYFGRIGDFI